MRRDVEQRRLHVAEDAGVVRRGREHEVAAAEGLGHDITRVRDGDVVHGDVAHAARGEHGGEHLRRVFRVAVDGGVGDEHAADLLGRVGAPLAVLIDEPADVLAPDGAVQRADHADVERGGLLEQGLHLRAVLADNVRIVAAGIRQPVVLKVVLIGIEIAAQRAERAEGIGGKERAGRGIKADHDLRPVDHRRHDIGKRVLAEAVCIALGHEDGAGVNVEGKIVADHVADLRVADDFRLGVAAHGLLERLGVVGLHVVHDDVVQRAAAEDMGEVFKKLTGDGLVHRVEQDGLFVEQDIGIVRHAARDGVHALKQGQTAVGRADPIQILGHFHSAVHTCLLLLIHNSPAQPRSLSSSSFGVTPTFTAAAWPPRNTISVGMLMMRYSPASSGCSSTLTLPNLYSGCSASSSSITGAIMRQGPHHVAQKSTSTGLSDCRTSCAKFSFVSVIMVIFLSGVVVCVSMC